MSCRCLGPTCHAVHCAHLAGQSFILIQIAYYKFLRMASIMSWIRITISALLVWSSLSYTRSESNATEYPTARIGQEIDPAYCDSVEFDLEYNLYKIQMISHDTKLANRELAADCCDINGWKAINLIDLTKEQRDTLLGGMGDNKYWTSADDLTSAGRFEWRSGELLSPNDNLWDKSRGSFGRCVGTFKDSTNQLRIEQVSCEEKRGIICELDLSDNGGGGNGGDLGKPDPDTDFGSGETGSGGGGGGGSCCKCCKASDRITDVTVANPGQTFEMHPSKLPSKRLLQVTYSIASQLSPSPVTGKNWEQIFDVELAKFMSNKPGEDKYISTHGDSTKTCTDTYKAYRKLTATCDDVTLTYFEPTVITGHPPCVAAGHCPIACMATDSWVLAEKYENVGKVGRRRLDAPPCFKFFPDPGSENILVAEMMYEFVRQLSPSPKTGVNWGTYYKNTTSGVPPEEVTVSIKKEVPPGHVMDVYQIQGKCGEYEIMIDVYKKVLFKAGRDYVNCRIAKENKVPHKGCQ